MVLRGEGWGKMNIGIVGQGFVGSAIKEGLKDSYDIFTYDLNRELCNSSLDGVVNKSEIIFVCLPTPMRLDGSCDTRILENSIDDIYNNFKKLKKEKGPILIIKSTVPPGTTQRINDKYGDLTVLFSPEFLTEANSFNDFKNQSRIIIGTPKKNNSKEEDYFYEEAYKVRDMFRKVFVPLYTQIIITDSSNAEMCKYFINCFLATKVTFSNQMFEICKASDLDYDAIKSLAVLDSRIGKSHLTVPGPDGDRGFGGHCFPKDLSGMIAFAEKNKINPYFLVNVERSNLIYRKNKDWEKMKGRAVSDD